MSRRRVPPESSEPAPSIDLVGVQGIILRRDPTRLGGGVCTVSIVMDGREVELLREVGDIVDAMAWPTGIKQRLQAAREGKATR